MSFASQVDRKKSGSSQTRTRLSACMYGLDHPARNPRRVKPSPISEGASREAERRPKIGTIRLVLRVVLRQRGEESVSADRAVLGEPCERNAPREVRWRFFVFE